MSDKNYRQSLGERLQNFWNIYHLKLNLIHNDFYGQYLHLSDHLLDHFWSKILSRVQMWDIILQYSNKPI